MCIPKSNSIDRYAITCGVIAYHLVHFVSIWVINKCQLRIDFFYQRAFNITPVLWKYRCPVQNFAEKHCDESETFAKCTRWNVNKGMRFASGTMKKVNKQCLLDTPRTLRVSEKTWQVIVQTSRPWFWKDFSRIYANKNYKLLHAYV